MDTARFDDILRRTLQDGRLSRGERRALGETLDEIEAGQSEKAQLRSRAFEIAGEQFLRPAAKKTLAWLEGIVKLLDRIDRPAAQPAPWQTAEVHFCPGPSCRQRLAELFRSARRSADVCVFTVTDNRIARAILEAHRRGVRVRIITDDEKRDDRGSDVYELARAGCGVVADSSEYHMHHKFAVFDGRIAVTGSFNWTRQASESNKENLVVTDDPRIVAPFCNEFERLWRTFSER